MWYGGGANQPAVSGSWSRAGTRKQSVAESDAPPPGGGGKPTSGRVIRIINNMDHSIQVIRLCGLMTIFLSIRSWIRIPFGKKYSTKYFIPRIKIKLLALQYFRK